MSVSVSDPNALSVKLRFPEFADTDDSAIEFALEEAKLIIGNNTHSARPLLILYLTAHTLVSGNIAAASGGGEIDHVSLGRISVTYARVTARANLDQNALTEDLQSTSYGRRYLRIMSKTLKPFEVIRPNRHSSW